jgi:hypothetical protein
MQIKSLKSGMNSSSNPLKEEKVSNKRSSDPFEKLIFEKGLRIRHINHFKSLKNATQVDLDKWELIGNGIGIHWQSIDEDLSLKGLIKDAALSSILHRLESKKDIQELSVL